jgi:hypothetical protein
VVLNFFLPADVSEAKKLLITEFPETSDNPWSTERRNSTSRPAHEAELDDIIDMLHEMDRLDILTNKLFAAVDVDKIPKFGPEELNVGYVVDRQVKMDAIVDKLSAEVQQLNICDND